LDGHLIRGNEANRGYDLLQIDGVIDALPLDLLGRGNGHRDPFSDRM